MTTFLPSGISVLVSAVLKTLEQDAGVQPFTDGWSVHATVQSPFRSRPLGWDEQLNCLGTVSSASNIVPKHFYLGVNNGGVWKTDDDGRTWKPIFDGAPTGSVGDIAVSPSQPKVIYVGTGEGLHRPDLSV
jgi:hypothetical protein